MKKLLTILAPPLLSGLLLGGIVVENSRHIKPKDVEPYHLRARAAVEAIPRQIGYWIGRDDEVPAAAVKLLRPNAIVSRTYLDTRPDSLQHNRRASLLVVQTKESRDMQGHYPPNCYVSNGMTPGESTPREWTIGDLTVRGMEYEFTQRRQNELCRTIVYNFLLIPGKPETLREMAEVYKAAEDYQQRYFGAAQFQLVFQDAMVSQSSREDRDEVFITLMEPNVNLIKTLYTGGVQ